MGMHSRSAAAAALDSATATHSSERDDHGLFQDEAGQGHAAREKERGILVRRCSVIKGSFDEAKPS